jgi:hypothetical protein
MDSEEVLLNPTEWLKSYLNEGDDIGRRLHPPDAFDYGRLAVGLEIETRIRIIRGTVGNSLLVMAREEICSVLHTVVTELQLGDGVVEWYDRLLDYQAEHKLRFEAVDDPHRAEAT